MTTLPSPFNLPSISADPFLLLSSPHLLELSGGESQSVYHNFSCPFFCKVLPSRDPWYSNLRKGISLYVILIFRVSHTVWREQSTCTVSRCLNAFLLCAGGPADPLFITHVSPARMSVTLPSANLEDHSQSLSTSSMHGSAESSGTDTF